MKEDEQTAGRTLPFYSSTATILNKRSIRQRRAICGESLIKRGANYGHARFSCVSSQRLSRSGERVFSTPT